MADPLLALAPRFAAALGEAFGEQYASEGAALRRSDRSDYQADVAMSLGKKLKRPPREIAETLVAKLDVTGICDGVEIAGPGFINLKLSDDFLSREATRTLGDERLGVAKASHPETVVVDYSAPNVAKEMHVGHIRTSVIGDALVRTLEFLGHRVIRQNHLGDWGTPFGMLIEHLLDLGADAAANTARSIADLNLFYQVARAKFDADPSFADRARQRVVLLQGGDEPTLALWRELVDQSKRHFTAVYAKLGVTLTDADVRGESFYNAMLPSVVAELEEKGLARTSDGAVCTFPSGFTGKSGDPLPLIIQKHDGGYGYATTDLAAIRYRARTIGATRILYVVGAPQQQHLAMVFATAKDAGWLAEGVRAEHVAFGSVLGADKKMFKTRSGDSVKLIELLDEAADRAMVIIGEKNPDLDETTRRDVARKIGIGAIKYADLASDRMKDYVFDWDRMLAFEGNTAPYLQYAHARIRSIFRRAIASSEGRPAATEIRVREPAERALVLDLLAFQSAAFGVAETLHPHKLCTYVYNLASRFTAFYEHCPVLKAEDTPTRESRLSLCDLTANVLAKGLDLLGIEAPNQM